MNLLIRGHPVERMLERGITREDIECALSNVLYSSCTARSNQYEGPGVDGRTLKVWTVDPIPDDLTGSIIVKSVAWKD